VLIGSIILVTAVTLLGPLILIGLALRKLYKQEGGSFASWHKRQLLAGLGLSIPAIGACVAIAVGVSLQSAELFLIGAGLTLEAIFVLRRLREKEEASQGSHPRQLRRCTHAGGCANPSRAARPLGPGWETGVIAIR
jgi:hypothetical protein